MTARRLILGIVWLMLGIDPLLAADTLPGHADIPITQRQSGSAFMSAETRALEADDTANPAMLWVLDGEDLWNRAAGTAAKSCASCHGDARTSMKGVAARYPAYDAASAKPVDLAGRINLCRTDHQNSKPLAPESHDLLALEAYVARQSRGIFITPVDDPRLAPSVEHGRALYWQRQGQLNLACGNCHTEHWGEHLGVSPIPQARPTGYPIYRLEWQSVGSLQRRLRGCLAGVRAEPYGYGSADMIDLEVYLRARASGLPSDAPAVRP